MTVSDPEVVAALGEAIAQRIGEPRYHFWFERHTKFTWEDDQLLVGVPNLHFQEWLESKFGREVREAASVVLGQSMRVRFAIDAALFQASRQAQEAVKRERPAAEPQPPDKDSAAAPAESRRAESRNSTARKRRWRHLGDFVVGPCNRMAHAAAVSVVEAPGQTANPLVLHGPVGTGKTHLLEGIYAGLRRNHSDWDVRLIRAEEFTNRFIQAMRSNKLGGFRKFFRECDALLLDDLSFLANKRATQEEFLHTLDCLQAEGRQLVVTCDCHPKLSGEWTPELTDRLLGGAVWGLLPPEADTRLEILRLKAVQGGDGVPEEVLRLFAEKLHGNVRELEGALNSVRHYSRVAARPVNLNLAREALGELFRHSVRLLQLCDVDRAVCRALRLDEGTLQAKARAWAISHPRMLAMYLARKHTAAAYSEIGQHFGRRNHSTVVAAEKKVRHWLENDGEMALGERRLRVREVVELAERELLR